MPQGFHADIFCSPFVYGLTQRTKMKEVLLVF